MHNELVRSTACASQRHLHRPRAVGYVSNHASAWQSETFTRALPLAVIFNPLTNGQPVADLASIGGNIENFGVNTSLSFGIHELDINGVRGAGGMAPAFSPVPPRLRLRFLELIGRPHPMWCCRNSIPDRVIS